MSKEIIEKAINWAKNPTFTNEARQEIQKLIDSNNIEELTERFYKGLEFGTGGMRGKLGQGINCINIYTVGKASQAVSQVILKENSNRKCKIIISYDSRNLSYELAYRAAEVFTANNIEVFIFKRLNPVALCSFAIRENNCQAGIMITASHNPPEYNGYKVFWKDGAQIINPNDKKIIDAFHNLSDFSKVKTKDIKNNNLIRILDYNFEDKYYQKIKSLCLNNELCKKEGDKLKIVYSALHGTGTHCCIRALNDRGFSNIIEVKEQAKPNGNFPTVKSPNPEDPTAMKMAVELMVKKNADIAMATDPDSDRVGLALNIDKRAYYLNGNQIGSLMLYYILYNKKIQNKLDRNSYCIKSIVSTELLNSIANDFSVEIFETLTGFKWMCGLLHQIEQESPEKNFIFATEESFGYLDHSYSRDKDAISSVALIAEMTLWFKKNNMNLLQALDEIYKKYGLFKEALVAINYEGETGNKKIKRIMEFFRNYSHSNFCDEKIAEIKDYLNNNKENLRSNVLCFTLENKNKIFIRPSGTEPKIKFYIMTKLQNKNLNNAEIELDKIINKISKYIYSIIKDI